MTDISRRLAQFAYDLGYETLPRDVVERTKLLILDTAGIMVRARNDVESTPSDGSCDHSFGARQW